MNIPKYQQIQAQRQQSNLQAQQILLQQLQQGQSQQHGSGSNAGGQATYMNAYQRSLQGQQPPQMPNMHQQTLFPTLQFHQQTSQQIPSSQQQAPNLQISQFQQDPLPYKQVQQNQAHLPQYLQTQQPPHLQLQYYNQQMNLHQNQVQKLNMINVNNSNTIYWQDQQQLCQLSRSANIPHFYARQYAANSRKNKNPYSDITAVTLVDAAKSIVSALKEQEKSKNSLANLTVNSALMHNKKSVQDLDDDLQEAQRMRQKTQGKQLWCQLDLSGQGLVNLSPKLFQYDFLESLYINNNKLTSIPPLISKLKCLRTLDLSGNKITEICPELGMCFNLRFLFLFDNEIRTLPHELGNLIELLFLGIEGNPLDLKLANLLAEKGTEELIAYLRDQNPVKKKPEPRSWLLLEDDGEVTGSTNDTAVFKDIAESEESDEFTLLSYNTLCQHYATPKMYKYTPSWALDWNFRRDGLKTEVLSFQTDIVCMQEVETRTYHEFWTPLMQAQGYKGVFFCKTRSKTMSEVDAKKVDGCATFYKVDKFELISKQNFEYNSVCMGSDKYKKTKDLFNRFMNKDHVALLTFLKHKKSGDSILVVNTHLHWDPAFNDVKTLQVGILLEELEDIMKKCVHGSTLDDIKSAPLIICGDFNSVKDSAVYELFSSGSVSQHRDLNGRDYGRFTEEGFRHVFKLRSAYDDIGELPLTTLTPSFTDVIDYVWYSAPSLQVRGLLGKVDDNYINHCIGFPNADFPSDHIPLVTKFQFKKTQAARKTDFKPDFKISSSRKT